MKYVSLVLKSLRDLPDNIEEYRALYGSLPRPLPAAGRGAGPPAERRQVRLLLQHGPGSRGAAAAVPEHGGGAGPHVPDIPRRGSVH